MQSYPRNTDPKWELTRVGEPTHTHRMPSAGAGFCYNSYVACTLDSFLKSSGERKNVLSSQTERQSMLKIRRWCARATAFSAPHTPSHPPGPTDQAPKPFPQPGSALPPGAEAAS